MSASTSNPADYSAAVDDLVLANRILYQQGVVDGMGHVSIRHPARADAFLLAANRAPGLVRRRDIVPYDFQGTSLVHEAPRPYLERFIHAEIYRNRADVMAVVHSHSASVIPFSVSQETLKPVYHMAGFLGSGAARFEIRDVAGNSDMLIRDSYLGQALAKSLGTHGCVLMRGHGSTVVGSSLKEAVFRAVYTEINARVQLCAASLGPVSFLNEEEARLAAESNRDQQHRPWELWVHSLGDVNLDE